MPAKLNSDPRHIRRRLGLTQTQFWHPIGVTQSGGSRYESGRTMPRPVELVFRMKYVEGIDPEVVSGSDFDVIEFLKTSQPEMYKTLKKQSRRWRQESSSQQ